MEENQMTPPSLMLVEPPVVSDETSSEILNFLYELINAFENHYGSQLRRYHEPSTSPQPDPLNLDGELPPF